MTLFGQSGAPSFNEGARSTFASSYQFAKLATNTNLETLKVAAYVRVSTLSSEQEDSLENQTAHYSRYIRSNPNWKLTSVYTDHGKSGTITSGRSGFNRLIRHALEGKIDLILCKSVSRFARNVMDTLDTVRMLKEHGVRVIFEKEDIDTESMQSEFILTTMAAVAQEESRSISENIKWANAKRFERGEPKYRRVLGYRKDEKRIWVVQKEEAAIVKEAFALCIEGKHPAEIARIFIEKGYETVRGRKEWSRIAVRDILSNNFYIGEVLCQKTFSKDYISHTPSKNKGEKNQYLIEDHHEPIIDKDIFNKVQQLLKKRSKPNKNKRKNQYPLSSRIVCGNCGGNLQRFICRGIVTWRCGKRINSHSLCQMDGVREETILEAMKLAMNKHYNLEGDEIAPKSKPIQNMIKDIKNIEMSGDTEYNQLRLGLERALFEENIALIHATTTELEEMKMIRVNLENKIKDRENWWTLIEKDYDYQIKAMSNLESVTRSDLENKLENIEFIRAWVVRVKALSPISFSITLVNGKELEITL